MRSVMQPLFVFLQYVLPGRIWEVEEAATRDTAAQDEPVSVFTKHLKLLPQDRNARMHMLCSGQGQTVIVRRLAQWSSGPISYKVLPWQPCLDAFLEGRHGPLGAHVNLMRFNKAKFKVLHLGHPNISTDWGMKGLRAALPRRTWDPSG
ncbi:hypothetical protein QYF61_025996 [Mycteria americana]|uniref:Uncharacterized protein n=1 Tax=Mycteria americana TaxID=33587 RepID=A0AAN7S4E6_MYCAM|nr:hypothetical protein QYF61_025996 [Mycteria americana]